MQNLPYERADARAITPSQVNVLIACEESQAECIAFRKLGFNAYSCDIQKCAGKYPEFHICTDVRPYLNGETTFITSDGVEHSVSHWHLIIAHPPCTYLCKVSSVQLIRNGVIDENRLEKMRLARDFFFECLNAKARYVAVENPLPMKRAQLPKPSCFACPSWFGEKYTKKTLYWLRNLPPLMAGAEFVNPKSFTYHSRGKYRSRTLPKLADAIAKQWGYYVIEDLPSWDF